MTKAILLGSTRETLISCSPVAVLFKPPKAGSSDRGRAGIQPSPAFGYGGGLAMSGPAKLGSGKPSGLTPPRLILRLTAPRLILPGSRGLTAPRRLTTLSP